jgi:hypothetical protein
MNLKNVDMEGMIKKTSAEVYEIHNNGEFACIAIQCHNFSKSKNAGRIMIHSTFGAWGYCWGSTGPLFKEFLCDLDYAYTSVKFGAKDVFNEEATLKAMMDDLKEGLDNGDLNLTEHHDAINAIKARIKNADRSFETWFYDNSDETILYDHFGAGMDLPIRENPEPQFKGFWDKLWPLFVQKLKEELSEVVHVVPTPLKFVEP